MPRPLGRYEGVSIAEQIGVVRLQDDATAGTRALIQGTQALAETSERLTRHAEAQYIADFELDQRKKAVELRAAHANDPEAFRKAWTLHTEGTIGAVPAAFRNRAGLSLKAVGESGYESVFNATAARTEANAVSTWKDTLAIKESEYLAKAAGAREGKYTREQVEAARVAYALHLEDGVRLRVMDEKGAALYRDQIAAKAAAEGLGEEAKKRYFEEIKKPAAAKSGEVDLDRALSVVRQGESSNRNVVGPEVTYKSGKKDRPYGLYQIMGANIPSWTKEVLGKSMTPEEFLADEAAQHKVARAKFGQFVKEHGLENAYAIWASGRPLAQSAEDKDLVFGTKVKDTVAARMAAYGESGTPRGRARAAATGVLDELRTDPAYASIRPQVTAAGIEARVRRAISDAEADHAQALAANNESLSSYVTRLSRGLDVDVAEASRRADEARRLGDPRSASRWDMIATKGSALKAFSEMTPAQQSVDLQAAFSRAQANPRDDAALFEYDIKRQAYEHASAAWKSDAFTHAARVYGRDLGTPSQIDMTKPDPAELQRRRQMVGTLEGRTGVEMLPFSAEEKARFASTWNAAPARDKAAIAAALYDGLGPKLAAKVFGTLSKDGNVDRASVYAAGIAERDPVLAREIYEGMDVLKVEKKPAPQKEEEFQRAFNEHAGTAFKHSTEARDGAYEASRALAAKWAKDNGKLGEVLPPEQARRIIERVVGPTVRHNGGTLLPPSRTMTQAGFDDMLSRIRDQDAPKLRAADGNEVSITRALRSGNLENIGDGRYIIRFGENYFLPDSRNPGRPFVLDRAFFEGVEARIAAEDMGAMIGGEPVPIRRSPARIRPWRPPAAPAPEWMRE